MTIISKKNSPKKCFDLIVPALSSTTTKKMYPNKELETNK